MALAVDSITITLTHKTGTRHSLEESEEYVARADLDLTSGPGSAKLEMDRESNPGSSKDLTGHQEGMKNILGGSVRP